MAFSDDSSYCLLCSLEILDEDGNLERKADMFTKRTIRQRTVVTHVDTATEALAISIAEKACVDMGFMQSLTGLSEEQIVKDLEGVIFRNPEKPDSEGNRIMKRRMNTCPAMCGRSSKPPGGLPKCIPTSTV
jgi:N12 class adenine-specific DNA methylase